MRNLDGTGSHPRHISQSQVTLRPCEKKCLQSYGKKEGTEAPATKAPSGAFVAVPFTIQIFDQFNQAQKFIFLCVNKIWKHRQINV